MQIVKKVGVNGKGVNSVVVKNIRYKEYLFVLIDKKIARHIMKRIQSKLHRIRTDDVYKNSLSCFDDKRYILDDGINSFTYFHKHFKLINKVFRFVLEILEKSKLIASV